METLALVSYSCTTASRFTLDRECCDVFVINTDEKRRYMSKMSSYNNGSKWENVLWFLENMDFWDDYGYMWFPDENIEIGETDPKAFLDIVRQKDLLISQPSVSQSCKQSSHPPLLNDNKNIFRRSSIVGIEAPCINTVLVKKTLLPFLQENREHLKSGWGVDLWWSHAMKNDLYVVDAVTIKTHAQSKELMKVGLEEKKHIVNKYKLKVTI